MAKQPELNTAIVSFLFSFGAMTLLQMLLIELMIVKDFVLLLLSAVILMGLSCGFALERKPEVAVHASGLGCATSLGVTLFNSVHFPTYSYFGAYLCIWALFHFSEYVMSALVMQPDALSVDSFLLNHSKEYWIAAVAAWIEFVVEATFLPVLKGFTFVSCLGVLVCVVGEVLRKGAMLTARRNFTHLIAYEKRPEHVLVTDGVYSLFRHPSYVGWFWWSIGTQLVLCNPVCLIAYSVVSWVFFDERIREEELLLINFFGVEYVEYQKRVPTGLPLIKGYSPDVEGSTNLLNSDDRDRYGI